MDRHKNIPMSIHTDTPVVLCMDVHKNTHVNTYIDASKYAHMNINMDSHRNFIILILKR